MNKEIIEFLDSKNSRAYIQVNYIGGSDGVLTMYTKESETWQQILRCECRVGRDGMGKVKEGDYKTPLGTYRLSVPFGIKEDPGALMPYLKVTDELYWCSDEACYNQLIDINEHPHKCEGEHLIEFIPAYHYACWIEHNKECIYPNGSAIFLHCYGKNPYTGGCVAVEEEKMKFILCHLPENSYIHITKDQYK